MFDEIESVNNAMYEEFLNLSNPENLEVTKASAEGLDKDNNRPSIDAVFVCSSSIDGSNTVFNEQNETIKDDFAEIEDARKDVDQMLMNCESIDKISNSLNEINNPVTITNNQEMLEEPHNRENLETNETGPKDSSNEIETPDAGDSHTEDAIADDWVEINTQKHQLSVEKSQSPTASEYATPPKSPEPKSETDSGLSTSPFTFSFQRPASTTPQDKKKRSSYLEKRQSHLGLFSLTKSSSLNKLSSSLTSLLSISDKAPSTPPDRSSARSASPNVPDDSSPPMEDTATPKEQERSSASYVEKRQSLGLFSLSKSSSLGKLSASLSSLLSLSDKSSTSPANQSTRSPSPSADDKSVSRKTKDASPAHKETYKSLDDKEEELVIRSIDSYCAVTCKLYINI